MKRFTFYTILCLILLSACSKEKKVTNTWKIHEAFINGQLNSDPVWNSWRMTLNDGGTYTLIFDGDTQTGVWEFNDDKTKLYFDKGTADEATFEIIKLKSKEFNVKYTDSSGNIELDQVPS